MTKYLRVMGFHGTSVYDLAMKINTFCKNLDDKDWILDNIKYNVIAPSSIQSHDAILSYFVEIDENNKEKDVE